MAGGGDGFCGRQSESGKPGADLATSASSGAEAFSGSRSFFRELDAKGFERGAEVDFLLAAEGVGLLRAKGTALCTRLRAVRETADLGRAFDTSACPARAQSSANRGKAQMRNVAIGLPIGCGNLANEVGWNRFTGVHVHFRH